MKENIHPMQSFSVHSLNSEDTRASGTFLKNWWIALICLGILPTPCVWTTSFGATIDLFDRNAQGDLHISSGALTMHTTLQVQPNPSLVLDGQTHVVLGAPEASFSFDGQSFGPIMASIPRISSASLLPDSGLDPISHSLLQSRAAPVPVVQIPFEPFVIPNNTLGGVGGTLTPAFPFSQPNNTTNSLGFVTITIDGNIASENIAAPDFSMDTSSQNLMPNPLPGAWWLYLTGISLWLAARQFFRKKEVRIQTFTDSMASLP